MKWMLSMSLMCLALAGCARSTDGGSGGRDMSAGGDGNGGNGGGGDVDLAGTGNGSDVDLAGTGGNGGDVDLAQPTSPPDLSQPPPPPDLAQPPADMTQTSTDVVVHVLIDNFCNSSTNPTVINAPLHVPLKLTFRNDSHDYNADVWSSSGYGFLDMAQGYTWKDPVDHCLNPNPYTEYFDVGIQGGPVGSSCPNYRLYIHCN